MFSSYLFCEIHSCNIVQYKWEGSQIMKSTAKQDKCVISSVMYMLAPNNISN